MQSPEIEYPDIYDYLINTPSKSERATQFLVSLFNFLDFFISEKAHSTVDLTLNLELNIIIWHQKMQNFT